MPLKVVNLDKLAVKIIGYTGADIEGVVREAAILALRKNPKAKEVTMKHFDEALEQVLREYVGVRGLRALVVPDPVDLPLREERGVGGLVVEAAPALLARDARAGSVPAVPRAVP